MEHFAHLDAAADKSFALSALVTLFLLTLALALRISAHFSALWFFASFLTSSIVIFALRGSAAYQAFSAELHPSGEPTVGGPA